LEKENLKEGGRSEQRIEIANVVEFRLRAEKEKKINKELVLSSSLPNQ
jgi:hypothetical protein